MAASIHTHFRNAVLLVWGSLRLAPMIISSALLFFQAPPKLLIQVPRFGKQYKTHQKIIPAVKLNVADLMVSQCKLFYLPHFAV